METDMMTVNLLRLCYHCDDAHLCETEEQCRKCWAEQGLLPLENEDEGQRETKQFLQMMHA
ncbi:hypothetical protein XI25_26645 [Paenibacillus sp. DMB20]|nr:hypothetical protein [Paenibacillus sp. DMB20]KKO51368.1 hypothetical protein XI25_26645 [Paenibacillus sp. DMB20]